MVPRRDVQVDHVQGRRFNLDKYLVAVGWGRVGTGGHARCGAERVDYCGLHCCCSFVAGVPFRGRFVLPPPSNAKFARVMG
jgi:hypothetical protein